jgi:hypothetical protein
MSWDRLYLEIENWTATGKEASLWWRDDDAVAATPALARLLAITGRRGIPLALAVIPAAAYCSTVTRIAITRPKVRVPSSAGERARSTKSQPSSQPAGCG